MFQRHVGRHTRKEDAREILLSADECGIVLAAKRELSSGKATVQRLLCISAKNSIFTLAVAYEEIFYIYNN